jgi:F-type H+-transporting ATPase subunit gamma
MANIRDIRRRIRSVKNTRQITKAMKMVAAAKLRRAQERALASRSYAQMLANVLASTVSRADLVNPTTGEPWNPLLAVRPEENILLVLVTGDRGLAGAFNSNVLKAATKFFEYFKDKNVDVLAIGRKGRDFLRRRYPMGKVGETRAGQIQVVAEHLNLLAKVDYESVSEIADRIAEAYREQQIDSVYVIFNEFKSVISQRLIAQRILPVQQLGQREVALAEEFSLEERERAAEAARAAGISLKEPPPGEMEAEAAKFATAPVDYIYEQSPAEIFSGLLPRYIAFEIFQ